MTPRVTANVRPKRIVERALAVIFYLIPADGKRLSLMARLNRRSLSAENYYVIWILAAVAVLALPLLLMAFTTWQQNHVDEERLERVPRRVARRILGRQKKHGVLPPEGPGIGMSSLTKTGAVMGDAGID